MSTPNIETDIVNQYLLDINIPRDANVPLEVFIAFPRTLNDLEIREKVRIQWLNGNDKQYVAMKLMLNKEISAIFRPTGVLIDWVNIVISVYMPSGLAIVIPTQFLKTFGATIEQQLENLNDYVFVTFIKENNTLVATEVTPLRGKIETEVAKEILEKTTLTPLELIITGLGYKPSPEIKRLFIPRIVTWFKGFDGKPMHIAQFTLPETAKTHWAIRNETLFNWRYIAEPPTLARLILDARQGILGEVFLRNGITFDEFDKWNLDTSDRRYTFDAILTGMEQGKWGRGVSAQGVRPPDTARLIPITFFGNLGDFAKLYGIMMFCTRAWFTEVYTRRLTHDVSALADRLCIIDACFIRIPVMDSLTYKVLPDSIMRGIVHILQTQVKQCDVSHLKGRLKRHSNNLYAIMNTYMKVTPEEADSIVAGTFEWDKKYITPPTVESHAPSRDLPVPPKPLIPAPTLTESMIATNILSIIQTETLNTPMIEKAEILKIVNQRHGITAQQFHTAYNQLLKEGLITEPKQGYVQKV
jgi:hypothetical protein